MAHRNDVALPAFPPLFCSARFVIRLIKTADVKETVCNTDGGSNRGGRSGDCGDLNYLIFSRQRERRTAMSIAGIYEEFANSRTALARTIYLSRLSV